jgi:hypothetical protein
MDKLTRKDLEGNTWNWGCVYEDDEPANYGWLKEDGSYPTISDLGGGWDDGSYDPFFTLDEKKCPFCGENLKYDVIDNLGDGEYLAYVYCINSVHDDEPNPEIGNHLYFPTFVADSCENDGYEGGAGWVPFGDTYVFEG